jgi:methionyl aminopeptidase
MITLKAPSEIARMRKAGAIVAEVIASVAKAAEPGVRLKDLDALAAERMRAHGAIPNFLNYHPAWAPMPYPGVVCLSLNEVIVHGIPDARRLKDGDILSIDCGVAVDGYHGDSAITIGIGEIDKASQNLISTAETALEAAIQAAQVGATLGDISHAVELVIRAEGFGIPGSYGGHGIGRAMHEAPHVPNTGLAGKGMLLREGLVLALEPMVLAGGRDTTRVLPDGWSVVTSDGGRAAHAEHTVAITSGGPKVLTAAAAVPVFGTAHLGRGG